MIVSYQRINPLACPSNSLNISRAEDIRLADRSALYYFNNKPFLTVPTLLSFVPQGMINTITSLYYINFSAFLPRLKSWASCLIIREATPNEISSIYSYCHILLMGIYASIYYIIYFVYHYIYLPSNTNRKVYILLYDAVIFKIPINKSNIWYKLN